MDCLRCGVPMSYIRREQIQLGKTGWLFGDLSNLISGALEVDIYACPKCGKIEFYQTEESLSKARFDNGETPQKKCPKCGKMHDFDFPKCPFCKYDYYGN